MFAFRSRESGQCCFDGRDYTLKAKQIALLTQRLRAGFFQNDTAGPEFAAVAEPDGGGADVIVDGVHVLHVVDDFQGFDRSRYNRPGGIVGGILVVYISVEFFEEPVYVYLKGTFPWVTIFVLPSGCLAQDIAPPQIIAPITIG